MKFTRTVLSTLVFTLGASATHAAVDGYFVGAGYIGKATVRSSGGCVIAPTTYEDAAMGNVYDSDNGNAFIGYGIVSAQGELIALEKSFSLISAKADEGTEKYSDSYFEDFSTDDTIVFIGNKAECKIEAFTTNLNSTFSSSQDKNKGKDSASLKYNFGGYTDYVCTPEVLPPGGKQTCVSKKFTGSISFKGEKPAP